MRAYLTIVLFAFMALSLATGCTDRDGNPMLSLRRSGTDSLATDSLAAADTASAYGSYVTLTREELERGRMDADWKRFVRLDTAAVSRSGRLSEAWTDITPARVNRSELPLPLYGEGGGPSVLRIQVLLDRSRFSPGAIDGKWGKNTEKAIYWLQQSEGLSATGQVDSTTYRRLMELAGGSDSLIVRYRLRADDVEGPFGPLPEDIYERAEMERMHFESLTEKLAERFHVSPELLAHLNPGVVLDSVEAGETIQVPNLEAGADTTSGSIARLVVSDGGHYVHAVDSTGRILYHFPSSLGSSYDPSPTGPLEVVAIAKNPWWHYQPSILADVPDTDREARIPPGPNNAVGTVWVALSEPHYGIHGTSEPEAIGYAASSGCVRLTNWDAEFLAERLRPGIPVQFQDVEETGGSEAAAATAARPAMGRD